MRKLLSEQWHEYVEEKKLNILLLRQGLLEILSSLDMENYKFEINEGHLDMDEGLDTFVSYELKYIISPQKRIIISVGDTHPTVLINGDGMKFEEYFQLTTREAYNLGAIFQEFAESIKKVF